MKKNNSGKCRMVFFVSAVGLFVLNVMLGFEPQMSFKAMAQNEPIQGTFRDYMSGSLARNGTNILVRTLTTAVYPGAKAGQMVHSLLVAPRK